ncbi:putative toxin-antitoxin system toxin component, PIN family [Patescibacteria group bacterium]|nr:putative toxin-antitoxin system toxin component, PIN family [Patescibacteria group bacterium]
MKLVLDTNIYIAAFLNKGLASDILKLAQRRKIELFISNAIIKEIRRKLSEKFGINRETCQEFIELILQVATLVKPVEKLSIVKTDPTDDRILECALKAKAGLIISMDKHLLKLKSFNGIGIVHPKTLTWIIPKLFL